MASLTSIAEGILADAKLLDEYTTSRGLGYANFEEDTWSGLSSDLEGRRKSMVDSLQRLKQLVHGPTGLLLEVLFFFNDLLALRFIYHYNIPSYVPLEGEISYIDIARASGLDQVLLRRFIQAAMMNRVFSEPRLGYVQHTAVSRLLRQDPEAMDTVGFLLEDLAPASTKVIEAFQKYPGSGEPNKTGFNIENNTSDPFYLELAKLPERSRRFGGGMRFMTRGSLYDINHLINGYDWAALDKVGGTVVDIGGGHGGVSRALAGATENLQMIVQDLPGTVEEGRNLLPEQLKGRVKFMAHDFFTEQPVREADVYFFRFILHNWSDKYCVQILRNLLPAMKEGSKIVIYEFLLPEMADTAWSKKQGRNLDMIQALGWNSLERTTSDWEKLFASVDPRYVFLGTRTPEGSSVSLIEAEFKQMN
ncbi:MAG: hypothetical protein Q9225_000718 [Loekoesia sp. 1 TL-2023]